MYTFSAQKLATVNAALGLKWKETGSETPATGTEIKNELLAAAQQEKVARGSKKLLFEFKNEDWNTFQVSDLSSDSYIKAGNRYFKPADAKDTGQAPQLERNLTELASKSQLKDGSRIVYETVDSITVIFRSPALLQAPEDDATAIMRNDDNTLSFLFRKNKSLGFVLAVL